MPLWLSPLQIVVCTITQDADDYAYEVAAAARKLGLGSVPVIELSHLSEAQKWAYVLADNKLAMNADWDLGLLANELRDLDTGEFDLTLTGFSEKELEDLLTWSDDPEKEGLTDEDAVPELRHDHVGLAGGQNWPRSAGTLARPRSATRCPPPGRRG